MHQNNCKQSSMHIINTNINQLLWRRNATSLNDDNTMVNMKIEKNLANHGSIHLCTVILACMYTYTSANVHMSQNPKVKIINKTPPLKSHENCKYFAL